MLCACLYSQGWLVLCCIRDITYKLLQALICMLSCRRQGPLFFALSLLMGMLPFEEWYEGRQIMQSNKLTGN